jgi:hypothetical protein
MRLFTFERGMGPQSKAGLPVLALALALALAGCGTTKQAREVTASGFLGDYSGLRKGGENTDDPLMVYVNPQADCRKYQAVMLDPVTLWAKADGSSFAKLEPTDRELLTTEAGKALREAVTKGGFALAQEPGPGVMHLRAALTEAEKSNVMMKEVSVVAPYASAAATVWAEGKGQALFTGSVAFEVEITDSVTGERLYAAADKRVGKMDPRNYHSWDDVKDSLKAWSERGVKRLANCRATGQFGGAQEKSFGDKMDKYMP